MKENWTCPKCDASDPLLIPGRTGARGGIPTTIFVRGNLQPSHYICAGCGYVEEYFEVPEHLEMLRSKYGGAEASPQAVDGNAGGHLMD